MSFITLDTETFYSKTLGFSTQTNEEYLRDPRFEVIGVAIKIDDGEPVWYSKPESVAAALAAIDWSESALLCHNVLFDGAILAWHYGIIPAFYYDTLCMARAIHGVEAGGSLASLARRYGIGEKGTEIEQAYGKRREDFTEEGLAKYGEYCKNDVELTYKLFHILTDNFPEVEHKLIDLTLRMYTQPVLEVDDAMLSTRLQEMADEKFGLLSALKDRLGCSTEEEVRKKLCSNLQFGQILQSFGVDPPKKISPRTGKEALALAKTDEGFLELQEYEDPIIQELCAVRLGTKSTMEESRIERFISIGGRNQGKLPVPLKYYGAHTGRWSGLDKVNFQNLPTRDKRKKTLKNSISAPDGYTLINCDSAQIEARVLAWLAGQDDIVEAFRQGRDVYCEDAERVYKRPITKADVMERLVGKTMRLGLGFGTGAIKLQHTLKTGSIRVDLPITECKYIVGVFREANDKIVDLWAEGDRALQDMMSWPNGKIPYYFGKGECVSITSAGIHLPNGLFITYNNLRLEQGVKGGEMFHDSRSGPIKIWGGTLVENIVQALARIIVGEQMLEIAEKTKIALTVHDAALCVVPDAEVEYALPYITEVMSTPPTWGAGIPVACEAKVGKTYGEV